VTTRSSFAAAWFALAASGPALAADGSPTARTGWFADEKCLTSRAEDGRTGPPGRSCTQECICKGVPVVFFDEECDHVRITGTLDEKAGTVRIATIKVIDPYVAKCDVK
jgi:hypothetical protein